jgi:hypothetical protein
VFGIYQRTKKSRKDNEEEEEGEWKMIVDVEKTRMNACLTYPMNGIKNILIICAHKMYT